MKKDCKKCCKSMCVCKWIAWALLIIGGINWGLVGIGMLASRNWNIVNLIFGNVMWLEAVIYLLVGLAALGMLMKCCCKKCKKGKCADGKCDDSKCADGSCDTHGKGEEM
jgi:uncharacterized membrane protein YuzA (DUF378 family)